MNLLRLFGALRSTAAKGVGKQLSKTTPIYDSSDKNVKVLPDFQKKLSSLWFEIFNFLVS